MNTVVCQVSVLQKLRMSTRAIRKFPLMHLDGRIWCQLIGIFDRTRKAYDLSMVVNKVDCSRAREMCEESVPWRHFVRVDTAKSKTSTCKCALLHFKSIRKKIKIRLRDYVGYSIDGYQLSRKD